MDTGYFQLMTQPKIQANISPPDSDAAVMSNSEFGLYFEPMGEFYYKKNRSNTVSDVDFTDSITPTTKKSLPKLDMWKREKIDDFVRKLGFIEAQTKEASVKTFQQLNQV